MCCPIRVNRLMEVFYMQTLPVDVDADIEKDVGRTFPSSARYAQPSR